MVSFYVNGGGHCRMNPLAFARSRGRPIGQANLDDVPLGRYCGPPWSHPLPRDPKITPITRHEPRTFYATRVTRTQAGESWDLWSVEDGRRIGFLSVVDDGHVVYALSTVKRGTSHEEVADLVEGFFTPSSTDAHNREIIISDYDEEPEMLESDIRQA